MIRVVTDLIKYELDIRAIINVFYPKHFVVFNDKRAQEKTWMTINIETDKNFVRVLFLYDENNIKIEEVLNEVSCCEHLNGNLLKSREVKNKLKRAIYKGLVKITGYESEWGTLTGVRPTKLAFMLKKEGLSQE